MTRALVYGLAVAGASTARALTARGYDVVAADDVVGPEKRDLADRLGVELLDRPDDDTLRSLLRSSEIVCPAPGVPEDHRVVTLARELGREPVSEIELAHRWERERPGGPRPMLAVTGTDGKTTTTLMTVAMLRAAGLASVDAGNTDTPLVDAIDDDLDAFVVECTSFRLAWTPTFRPDAGAWLNLAPDHLNWHRDMASYEAAKARIWANQRGNDVAIGFADDPVVMRHLAEAPARRRTFGLDGADYHLDGDVLTGPDGPIADRGSMRRGLPHDVTNALAAAALVLETGLAAPADVEAALATFDGPRHRLERLGTLAGAEWYNASKATTPHAAAVAIHAFDDIVLIAGGKDKHVDLAEMAVEAERVRAVIALGETRDAVADAFASVPVVETVADLDRAVERAAAIAAPGQVVLLSPGCASLDQFPSFEHRGDRFRELFHALGSASGARSDQPSDQPSDQTSAQHDTETTA